MGQIKISLLAALCILMCSFQTKHVSSFACKEVEIKALLKFKESFIDRSNRLSSWVAHHCCSWQGVSCSNITTGYVTGLDLGYNGWGYLSASKVDPALAELKHLKHLDLSGNDFRFSPIPQFLGSLKQLRYLNLSLSQFAAKIPHQLGNLTQLRVLDLSYNGIFQSNNWDWLAFLQNLHYLNFDQVDLTRTSTTSLIKVLYRLLSLVELRISTCQLKTLHFSPEFFNSTMISPFSNLQILDLSQNQLEGPFPYFIVNMSSLVSLNLQGNGLNGSLPYWLGNNKKLQHLDVSRNQITSVANDIWDIIANSCHLKYLDLSYNDHHMLSLRSNVNLSRCIHFNLEELYMNDNNISGHLSSWLGEFRSLKILVVSGNYFSGHVPVSLRHLTSLQVLDLSYCNLGGTMSKVFFSNLSNLSYLGLASNSLTIQLPLEWIPPFQLQYLLMGSCKINTSFPKWLQLQRKLILLDLSSTGLQGLVGDMSMPSLSWLNLANNNLTGSIPRSFCILPHLKYLDLNNNKLSGSIPACYEYQNYRDLEYIDLSSNELSGPIPHWLTNYSPSLEILKLNNNFLEGEIKIFSGQIIVLDLGDNNFSGNLSMLNRDNIPSIQILRLRDNHISGMIPLGLCSLHNLVVLDLANNNMMGVVPSCFGHIEGMKSDYNNVNIAGNIPPLPKTVDAYRFFVWSIRSIYEVMKGQLREYNVKLDVLVAMDLSNNHFVGSIPFELTSLSALVGLNLSNNHLRGPIPWKIGEMKALESLDLSRNQISGIIPQGMSELSFLNYLNLSYNQLHGRIPTGSLLQTLVNPFIYIGNPGLCGDPLPNKCSNNDIDQKAPPTNGVELPDEEGEERLQKVLFYLVIILGVAIGFWGVIGILFVKKNWRYAYFRFAEVIADWIYANTFVSIGRLRRKFE